MKTAKSFTFKVAQKNESDKQVKVREGVAVAGCSLVEVFPGFKEPKYRSSTQTWPYTSDDGYWC